MTWKSEGMSKDRRPKNNMDNPSGLT